VKGIAIHRIHFRLSFVFLNLFQIYSPPKSSVFKSEANSGRSQKFAVKGLKPVHSSRVHGPCSRPVDTGGKNATVFMGRAHGP